MVTIKDIASRLNVSASTVGRALSDDPRISAETKQKVAQVANEIGYVANRAARMMRGASSNIVGLIVPDIRNSFYSTIAHALSKCMVSENLQLMLSESDDDRDIELKHVRELIGANVTGIIIVPSAKPHPDAVRALQMVPHIQLLRKHEAIGQHWFGIADTQALRAGTEHLIQLGHRHIAYIGGTELLPTGRDRLKGFRDAIQSETKVLTGHEELAPPNQQGFGRDALLRLFRQKTPPTAIITGSVQHTLSLMDGINELGLSIPDDLSVVGFGDEASFKWWQKGLTTMGMPVSELATTCGLWFIHQIKQKEGKWPPYSSVSPATLVFRGSTKDCAGK